MRKPWPDTYIPYNYRNQLAILPSFKSSLEACAELLGYDLEWLSPVLGDSPGHSTIYAIGSGPADETVEIIKLYVKAGDTIQTGDVIAEVEATKAIVEIRANVSGTALTIFAKAGDQIAVNAPLVGVQTEGDVAPVLPVSLQENYGIPRLTRRLQSNPLEGISEYETVYVSAQSGKPMPADIDNYLSTQNRNSAEPMFDILDTQKMYELYSDIPISPQQSKLIFRMNQSSKVVVPANIARTIDWQRILDFIEQWPKWRSTACPSELQIFAYCVSQAVKFHPKFRSPILKSTIMREYKH
jgi:hypothetical protein